VVPSAVGQRILVKFLANEKVNPAEILKRLGAQFGDETLSRTHVYDSSKSFKEGRTEGENMRRLHLIQGKLRPSFLGLSRRLIHRFGDRTTNHQRSFLKTYQSRLSYKMTMSISQKLLSASRQRASAHRHCDNRNTVGNELEGTATLCL
jgi:hypothetical protein